MTSIRTKTKPVAALAGGMALLTAVAGGNPSPAVAHGIETATPIKHLVVIFDENVSFDHYFGTYPHAANTDGTPFHPRPGTPHVNGLNRHGLLNHNPNHFDDGTRANPQRLAHFQAVTCDQDHNYTAEQQAYHAGAMDAFVQYTNTESCDPPMFSRPGLVMDYYDGNTVTALWNYAQRFAMSDNSYNTTFGPSTPGALNLISGQTGHAVNHATANGGDGHITTSTTYGVRNPDGNGEGTVINDPDPYFDDCANKTRDTVQMKGKNIGDLLNASGTSWGWFEGGFRNCAAGHTNIAGIASTDYVPHHEPFQYYASTANPHHLPPASVAEIGHDGQANHQYDLTDWYAAVNAHDLPAVSFLKAPAYQDGHAGYSDPLDEQHFLVHVMNRLQRSPAWSSTAVVLAYDDSDGWYDHQPSPIVNASTIDDDALDGPAACTHTPAGGTTTMLQGEQDRCGYGPRLPLLVMSPYAKTNTVDHTLTDQTSLLRFIEDNWLRGRRIDGSYDHLAGSLDGLFCWHRSDPRPLILDPSTGAPLATRDATGSRGEGNHAAHAQGR